MLLKARAGLAPRTLPNGKEYCIEDARTDAQRDECALDLEDGFFLSNTDKALALKYLERDVQRIKLMLRPCAWYERALRNPACIVPELKGDK